MYCQLIIRPTHSIDRKPKDCTPRPLQPPNLNQTETLLVETASVPDHMAFLQSKSFPNYQVVPRAQLCVLSWSMREKAMFNYLAGAAGAGLAALAAAPHASDPMLSASAAEADLTWNTSMGPKGCGKQHWTSIWSCTSIALTSPS